MKNKNKIFRKTVVYVPGFFDAIWYLRASFCSGDGQWSTIESQPIGSGQPRNDFAPVHSVGY
ncbi:hypothetical protein [Eubacterium callanderi]|uniref:hypothetical protein n=1 Tax=Eubacterium callanderi TaxID=53442 RepID=UPI00210BE032|nr:hypothetical protein [Eubacterium callanderi]